MLLLDPLVCLCSQHLRTKISCQIVFKQASLSLQGVESSEASVGSHPVAVTTADHSQVEQMQPELSLNEVM